MDQPGTRALEVTAGGDFVKFNTASDLDPTYFERKCNMRKVKSFCDQLVRDINSGYKNNHSQKGVTMNVINLIKPMWVQ